MGPASSLAVWLVLFASASPVCESKILYFASTASNKTYVVKLDLESPTHQHTTILEYPKGIYNPGGGATGICRLGNKLYWGDQTTDTVHSADLASGGNLTDHDPSFITNLSDPQGVACDRTRQIVYVIDATGVFHRSPRAGAATMPLDMSGVGVRAIKMVAGNLWFGTDSGILRSEQPKVGPIKLTLVPLSNGKIYEDFEVVNVPGEVPRIFASAYDWSGTGILTSELDHQLRNLTSSWQPMKGGACKRGSELTWGIAADSSAKLVYWIVEDDAAPNHMKVMYKRYDTDEEGQVMYAATGSGYGIYLDSEGASLVLV